jgi:hypothetical protein
LEALTRSATDRLFERKLSLEDFQDLALLFERQLIETVTDQGAVLLDLVCHGAGWTWIGQTSARANSVIGGVTRE